MLQEILDKYLARFPEEREGLRLLIEQVEVGDVLNDRKNFRGHITGSGLVLSPDRKKLLVVYHKLFKAWLQPGGHWDPHEAGPWEAAQRESEEETGVQIGKQVDVFEDFRIPLVIGIHPIMNRPQKKEPAHNHYDFRYLFLAKNEDLYSKKKEVNILETAWLELDDPRLAELQNNIRKMRSMQIV